MDTVKIGSRREVCWDTELIDSCDGVKVEMHKPEYRGVAFTCDALWEGNESVYFQVMNTADKVRLYYRGAGRVFDENGSLDAAMVNYNKYSSRFCCAESSDGKTFTRPSFGIFEVNGSSDNNIITREPHDNFCIFKDENPACPPDELYKALAGKNKFFPDGTREDKLVYYKSADGIHFTEVGTLLDDGAYDSLNLAFWDKTREKYFIYYRGIHKIDESLKDSTGKNVIRDVRVRTSPDFIHWDTPRRIEFDADKVDVQLYTNQIQPYYRAPHMFLGMPTRYTDLPEDSDNFNYLPDREYRRKWLNLGYPQGREGYGMTDCILMTTRDGYHFRRTDEVFLAPGPEYPGNWYYGDCFPALSMVETDSDGIGFPREISIYTEDYYHTASPTRLLRYAIRIDGFFSWNCPFKGGSVLTKPLSFSGNDLRINFSTSALGYIRIYMCDADGTPIDGFDSGKIVGDSLDRPVNFSGDLKSLSGRDVRMKIEMKDADLYSFKFND